MVIIGAGIVGCSVAYHLTRLGWRDIVVLEQGPLFETGGSTSHAPGLVFQVNPSKTMTGFARYSVDLWTQLELDGVPCAKTVGSLEVAWTPERLVDLRRKAGYGLSWGVEAHLLSSREARELVPMLSDRVLGALYVPTDIHTKATRPAEAMAREAERVGAKFYGRVKVTGFDFERGRIRGVQTTAGGIQTDLVVAAAGIWAPKVGGMAGVPIPLSPMQHLSAVTTPLSELAGATEEISQPLVRHQDEAMYFRQEGDCYGIGSYRHEPLLCTLALADQVAGRQVDVGGADREELGYAHAGGVQQLDERPVADTEGRGDVRLVNQPIDVLQRKELRQRRPGPGRMEVAGRITADLAVAHQESVETADAGDEARDRPWRQAGGHAVADERLEVRLREGVDRCVPGRGMLQQRLQVPPVALQGVRRKAARHAQLVQKAVDAPPPRVRPLLTRVPGCLHPDLLLGANRAGLCGYRVQL